RPPPVEITSISMGWQQSIPAGRWAPMTVWVTSAEHAFSGVLSVEYGQDATQNTLVAIPIATTPGQLVPFELEAAIPARGPRGSFVITAPKGREAARWTYAVNPPGDEMMLPPISHTSGLILSVGDTTARLATENSPINDLNAGAPPVSPAPPSTPATI